MTLSAKTYEGIAEIIREEKLYATQYPHTQEVLLSAFGVIEERLITYFATDNPMRFDAGRFRRACQP